MNFNSLVARFAGAFSTVRSASHVVAAFEARRQPDPKHLQRLGIDPEAFGRIRHG